MKELQKKVEDIILASYEEMYRLAYSYVRNEQDALDIVQETVYKSISHAEKIKYEQYAKTWIWRILINTALDFKNSQKPVETLDECKEEYVFDKAKDIDMEHALSGLKEKERLIIQLYYFEEWKLEEIAQIMKLNVNTVKSILYRSLRKLKTDKNLQEKPITSAAILQKTQESGVTKFFRGETI